MRVVSLFLKYTIGIIIFGIVVAVVGREILLFIGTQQVKRAINRAELVSRSNVVYEDMCREKSSGAGGRGIKHVQVRFTSDTEYQIEVICNVFSNDPIVVESFTLFPQVKKAPGESGIIWDTENTSGLALEVYGRQTTLVVEGGKVHIKQGHALIEGLQPASTCNGFGYSCCTPETEVGEGDLFSAVTDCAQQCYPVCVPRPSVLRFTSDPNPTLDTRTATINRNDPVTFYFVTDPGQAGQAVTTIDFGDGQLQEFAEKDANITHTYACAQAAPCQYKATVNMLDPNGQINLPTAISTITIVVR